jgi:hypothetical protein
MLIWVELRFDSASGGVVATVPGMLLMSSVSPFRCAPGLVLALVTCGGCRWPVLATRPHDHQARLQLVAAIGGVVCEVSAAIALLVRALGS